MRTHTNPETTSAHSQQQRPSPAAQNDFALSSFKQYITVHGFKKKMQILIRKVINDVEKVPILLL